MGTQGLQGPGGFQSHTNEPNKETDNNLTGIKGTILLKVCFRPHNKVYE